ncbi:MAG: leucyl aminopeptidase, partial [Pseudomonadota bacterium]
MPNLPEFTFTPVDVDAIATAEGQVAVFVPESGKLDLTARRVNRLTKGALQRFVESDAFEGLSDGSATRLSYPAGMAAEAVHVIRLEKRSRGKPAREAGAALGAALGEKGGLLLAPPGLKGLDDILLGLSLRAY